MPAGAAGADGADGAVPAALNYTQITASVPITSTDSATPDTVITAGAITVDGSTRIKITFFAPSVTILSEAGGNAGIFIVLNEGTTELGMLADILYLASGAAVPFHAPVGSVQRILTPTNGSHTYSVTAWALANNNDGNSAVQAGNTAAGDEYLPAFLLIEECP